MRRPILLASALALLGCQEPLHPDPAGGTFVLDTRSPVELRVDRSRVRILADTLRLNQDGTATRRTRVHASSEDSFPAGEEAFWIVEYRYEQVGNRIEFVQICPPNALCTAPPHLYGRVGAGELLLREGWDPRTRLRFRRD